MINEILLHLQTVRMLNKDTIINTVINIQNRVNDYTFNTFSLDYWLLIDKWKFEYFYLSILFSFSSIDEINATSRKKTFFRSDNH